MAQVLLGNYRDLVAVALQDDLMDILDSVTVVRGLLFVLLDGQLSQVDLVSCYVLTPLVVHHAAARPFLLRYREVFIILWLDELNEKPCDVRHDPVHLTQFLSEELVVLPELFH